jgi:dTDP-4-dehydrorhamnose reductase
MGSTDRLLLLGKDGQVGFELQRALAPLGEVVALGSAHCDLADATALRRRIADIAPRIIVNAAAYTAVDRAEAEPERARAINAVAPGVIGTAAEELGAWVVHYSTDYVFDGLKEQPYTEADTPAPRSVYGATKLAGEAALAAACTRHLIFRTSWVFGAHGGNFAKTILRLAGEREALSVVADQFGAPTSAALIADVTAQILGRLRIPGADLPPGLYHLAAGGETTWHEYAQAVIRLALARGAPLRLTPEQVKPIASSEYPLPAKRPANSRLDTTRLRETFALHLPGWQLGLEHMLAQIL